MNQGLLQVPPRAEEVKEQEKATRPVLAVRTNFSEINTNLETKV